MTVPEGDWPKCVVCGTDQLQHRHDFPPYRVVRCRRCGLHQTRPLPDPRDLRALYEDPGYFEATGSTAGGYAESYERLGGALRVRFRVDLDRISRLAPGPDLLEVGCGPGVFLEEAERHGFRTRGVDLSSWAVSRARERQLNVECGTLEDYSADNPESADVVYASHVVEHLLDPVGFLKSVVHVARPGALIVFVTPNRGSLLARASGARWVSYKLPEHLLFFDDRSIRFWLHESLWVEAVEPTRAAVPLTLLGLRIRELLHPLLCWLPLFESGPYWRDRIVQVTDGSFRILARRVSERFSEGR